MHIASTTLPSATGRLLGICLALGLLASAAAASTAVPFISFTNPPSASPGGGNLTVKVHGTGFQQSSQVNWTVGTTTTTLATTYVSSHELDATVSSGLLVAGTATVTVKTPGASASNPSYFPVNSTTSPGYGEFGLFAATSPTAVAVGDFNNDGILDLAVLQSQDGEIKILLGIGNGNFTLGSALGGLGQTPTAIAVGDYNNDGKLDLLVGFQNGSATILLGNGNGYLSNSGEVISGLGSALTAILVGDLNEDGDLDAVFISTSQVTLAFGTGNGSFFPDVISATGDTIVGGALADFNGDGYLDLAQSLSGHVDTLLGNRFGNVTQGPIYSAISGSAPNYFAVLDYNGDGIADLVVPNTTNGSGLPGAYVIMGNGDGSFGNQQAVAGQGPCNGVAAGDMNGDGLPDVVLVCGTVLHVALQGPGSSFTNDFPVPLVAGTNPSQVTLADFNGDGILDILIVNQAGNQLTFLLSGATTAFSPSSLNFAPLVVGYASGSQQITLSNAGGKPAQIDSISATGDFSQTNNCGGTLALGATCTITVTFTPTATGNRQGTIVITDNSGGVSGGQQWILLTGTGIGDDPSDQLSASSLNFPDQFVGTTSSTQSITLTSNGNYALAISSIAANGDFAQTNNCGASVAIGSSCTINVTFTPTAAGGRPGTVVITDDLGGVAGTTQTIFLTGTGDTIEAASLSAGSLSFLSQAVQTTSAAQSVTLTNTAQGTLGTLSIARIAARGAFAQTNNCPSSMAPGASCTIQVTFTPSVEGPVSGTLTITDNSGGTAGSKQQVSLTGYGRPAPATYATPYVSSTSRLSAQPGANAFELTAQLGGRLFIGDLDWRVGTTVTKLTANNNSVHIPQHLLANAGTATLTFVNADGAPANGTSNPILFPIATKRTDPIFSETALSGVRADTVATGDFNGDGLPDIVYSNSSKLEVLLGDGQGNFHAAARSSAVGATVLALGDFNGDGKLDVVASSQGGPLSILLGNGDGTFRKPILMNYDATHIETADLNGDGYLDLVLVSIFHPVQVLLGNGDGTFGPGTSFNIASNEIVNGMSVGNFGGPVGLDLLVLTSESLFTYYGKGDGTFTQAGTTAIGGYALAVGPFFGEFSMGAAIVTPTGIALLQSGGGGSWFQPGTTIKVSGNPEWLAAADFNGDGKLDLAVLSRSGGAVTLLLGDGNGNLAADNTMSLTGKPSQLAIGDFNGDGRLDLVSSGSSVWTVIQPPFEVSAGKLHFRSTGGLPSKQQTLRLKNTGTQALTFSGVTVTGAKASEFSSGLAETCSPAVAAGASCTVTITYTPSKEPESSEAQLVLTDDAGTQQIRLEGRSKP